jgi:excisionase family DNA binding protein
MSAARSTRLRPVFEAVHTSNGHDAERLLTADDVAALLSVPKSWVYAETRAGRIPFVPMGRYRRYRREAIAAWVRARERGPIDPDNRWSAGGIGDSTHDPAADGAWGTGGGTDG